MNNESMAVRVTLDDALSDLYGRGAICLEHADAGCTFFVITLHEEVSDVAAKRLGDTVEAWITAHAPGVSCVVLQPPATLEVLTADVMRRLGWVPAPKEKHVS